MAKKWISLCGKSTKIHLITKNCATWNSNSISYWNYSCWNRLNFDIDRNIFFLWCIFIRCCNQPHFVVRLLSWDKLIPVKNSNKLREILNCSKSACCYRSPISINWKMFNMHWNYIFFFLNFISCLFFFIMCLCVGKPTKWKMIDLHSINHNPINAK